MTEQGTSKKKKPSQIMRRVIAFAANLRLEDDRRIVDTYNEIRSGDGKQARLRKWLLAGIQAEAANESIIRDNGQNILDQLKTLTQAMAQLTEHVDQVESKLSLHDEQNTQTNAQLERMLALSTEIAGRLTSSDFKAFFDEM